VEADITLQNRSLRCATAGWRAMSWMRRYRAPSPWINPRRPALNLSGRVTRIRLHGQAEGSLPAIARRRAAIPSG
jgi:hypothetical protein